MKLSSTNIKKCLVFSQTTAVFIFRKTETLKNYLYFRKWNFLIFQERYNQNHCITEFFCISGKVYSQHWHDSAFLYFNKVIFRTLTHIEQGTYQNLGRCRTWGIFRTLSKHLRWNVLQVLNHYQHFSRLMTRFLKYCTIQVASEKKCTNKVLHQKASRKFKWFYYKRFRYFMKYSCTQGSIRESSKCHDQQKSAKS